MKSRHGRSLRRQRGAELIEFTLVALALFGVLFAIMEFGRFFYVSNTVQEVTRRAARAQTVKWVSQTAAVQRDAVFQPGATGTVSLPAGAEVTNARIVLGFYNSYSDAQNQVNELSASYGAGSSAQDNVTNCLNGSANCIQYVRASLQNGVSPVNYVPMIPLFVFFAVPLPGSTVIMPAEALGLL